MIPLGTVRTLDNSSQKPNYTPPRDRSCSLGISISDGKPSPRSSSVITHRCCQLRENHAEQLHARELMWSSCLSHTAIYQLRKEPVTNSATLCSASCQPESGKKYFWPHFKGDLKTAVGPPFYKPGLIPLICWSWLLRVWSREEKQEDIFFFLMVFMVSLNILIIGDKWMKTLGSLLYRGTQWPHVHLSQQYRAVSTVVWEETGWKLNFLLCPKVHLPQHVQSAGH